MGSKAFAVFSALVLSVGAARAEMVTAQNVQSVVKAMQAAGYKAEVGKGDDGDPLIVSATNGSQFWVYFYNCTKNVDCRTIQFNSGYDKKASLEELNAWNAKQRFSRAYAHTNGNARLEMDLDLDDGGISVELFKDNLEYWDVVSANFAKHIKFGE